MTRAGVAPSLDRMAEGERGAKRGNSGQFKPGDPRIRPGPGRPTDKARAEWKALAQQGRKALKDQKILDNPDHPVFPFALKHSTQYGEGLPVQQVDVTSGGLPLNLINAPGLD